VKGEPEVTRNDIKLYLHQYFRYALGVVGEPRKTHEMLPMEVLKIMEQFWHLTGLAQDTVAICLEVQQLYLYSNLKYGLLAWFDRLPKANTKLKSGKSIRSEHFNQLLNMRRWLLHGATNQRKDAEADRVFFIDIIARRLLFWSCLNQFRYLYKQEVSIYAELDQLEPTVKIDDLRNVHYGNIDVNDQSPLDDKLYNQLTNPFFVSYKAL
jgi:hypothetical protein